MAWRVELTATAVRQLARLDTPLARRISDFLRELTRPDADPRTRGKAVSGPLGEFWSYRVGEYRLICEIHDATLRVLVLRVGHRKDVYR